MILDTTPAPPKTDLPAAFAQWVAINRERLRVNEDPSAPEFARQFSRYMEQHARESLLLHLACAALTAPAPAPNPETTQEAP